MAMQMGSAARVASLARASGVALVGLLGVDAGAGVDAGVLVGDGFAIEGVVHGVGAFADADGEDGVDAGGVGAGEDCFAVFGVEVEMGVGVDEGHRFGWRWGYPPPPG